VPKNNKPGKQEADMKSKLLQRLIVCFTDFVKPWDISDQLIRNDEIPVPKSLYRPVARNGISRLLPKKGGSWK